jgi:hypothetical protein
MIDNIAEGSELTKFDSLLPPSRCCVLMNFSFPSIIMPVSILFRFDGFLLFSQRGLIIHDDRRFKETDRSMTHESKRSERLSRISCEQKSFLYAIAIIRPTIAQVYPPDD